MARFGQGFIQSLINPAYGAQLGKAGMLAGSLPGALRARDAARERMIAQQGMFQILNQGNPLDPQVAQQVHQMGAAINMSPEETQEMLNEARTQARETERLIHARNNAKFRAAEHKWEQQEQARKETNRGIAKVVERGLEKGVDFDKVMVNVPDGHKGFAREYYKKIQDFRTEEQKRFEEAQAGTPLTEEELESRMDVLDQAAIDAYRSTVKAGMPRKARTQLEELYSSAKRKQLEREADEEAERMRAPTSDELEYIRATIDRELGLDLSFQNPFAEGGIRSPIGVSGLSETEKENLAYAAAAKRRTDPKWVPTKPNLEALVKELGIREDDNVPTSTPSVASPSGKVKLKGIREQ